MRVQISRKFVGSQRMMTALLFLSVVHPAETPMRTNELRVGAIQIYGNIVTSNSKVQEALAIFPGQRLPSDEDLKWAEMRLLVAYQKRFDLINHVRPRVIVRPTSGSDFLDVWVIFPEWSGTLEDGKRSPRPRLGIGLRREKSLFP